jgi:hypothetical protein
MVLCALFHEGQKKPRAKNLLQRRYLLILILLLLKQDKGDSSNIFFITIEEPSLDKSELKVLFLSKKLPKE